MIEVCFVVSVLIMFILSFSLSKKNLREKTIKRILGFSGFGIILTLIFFLIIVL